MKAVVFHGIGDIRLDNVPEPRLEKPDDALVAEYGAGLHIAQGAAHHMQIGPADGAAREFHDGVVWLF